MMQASQCRRLARQSRPAASGSQGRTRVGHCLGSQGGEPERGRERAGWHGPDL